MVQARSLLDESPANSFPISVAVGRRAPAANVACAQAGIIENLPALAAAVRTQDRALEVLIAAAVGPRVTGARAAVVKTLIDFPFWKSLVDAGTPRRQVPSIITDLALSLVAQTVR